MYNTSDTLSVGFSSLSFFDVIALPMRKCRSGDWSKSFCGLVSAEKD